MGRKPGYKHSEETKRKISEKLKGRKHAGKRKDNISEGLKEYHRKREIYEDMVNDYKHLPKAMEWIECHKCDIENWDDVVSEAEMHRDELRRIDYRLEWAIFYGQWIPSK